MASQELLTAAALQLRAKALEAYAIIKDTLHSPAEEGDVNKIAQEALKVAQYEGAMLTLQGYESELLSKTPPPPDEAPPDLHVPYSPVMDLTDEQLATINPPVDEADEDRQSGGAGIRISEEELINKSPTYKKSLEEAKLKGLNKKKSED